MSELSANQIYFDLQEVLSPHVVEKAHYDDEIKDARVVDEATYASVGDAIRGVYAKLDGLKADKSQIGSPLTAATAAAMTDTGKIYVYTGGESGYTYGSWYYYTGSAWQEGGTYNAAAIGEKSVTLDKLKLNCIQSLTDMSGQNSVGNSYTHDTGADGRSAALSAVVSVEEGVTYFGYIKINITALSGYVSGYLYLNFLNSLSLICSEAVAGRGTAIGCGSVEMYGAFTPSSSGTVKAMLYANNFGDNPFSYTFTVEKLYLIQDADSDVLPILRSGEYSETPDYLVPTVPFSGEILQDGTVTEEKLSSSLLAAIGQNTASEITDIDCWGDSLTEGAGGDGTTMPGVLQTLVGEAYTVHNYGQGGETAEAIAFRQGGIHAVVQPFTVPSSASELIPIEFEAVNGADITSVSYGGKYNGNGYVYIDGDQFFFRKSSATEAYIFPYDSSTLNKSYSRPARMIAEGKGVGHIMLLCIGQNGWLEGEISYLVDLIRQMVAHNGNEKYLVIGRPTGTKAEREEEEQALAAAFGNHFFNARDYLSRYGLADNDLTATADDESLMQEGAIPSQLLSDEVHGNAYFYTSFAIGVYGWGKSLGLW